jgi:hypothetical protein
MMSPSDEELRPAAKQTLVEGHDTAVTAGGAGYESATCHPGLEAPAPVLEIIPHISTTTSAPDTIDAVVAMEFRNHEREP